MKRDASPMLLLALMPLVSLMACAPGRAETTDESDGEAVPVFAAPVTTERMAQPVRAAGTLGTKDEVVLSFKVGGLIDRLAVEEGETVRAGQLLAALNTREIDATVTRARSAAEKTERDLGRARRLLADSVATLEQVQNEETALEVARADLATAEFNRRHATITAPAGGTILRRHADPGELVAPGTPILTLGSRARGLVMRAGLPDRDVVRVHRGDSAIVHVDALPDLQLRGVVSEIGAAPDPRTGVYVVEVRLTSAGDLPTGLMGHVEIRPSAAEAVTLVPVEALLEADGEHGYVLAVSPDGRRAERRDVTIAFLSGDRVAITDGLDGVRHVITRGAAYVSDGEAVRVRP